MKNRHALSNEEIEQFKNFDAVLVKHASMLRGSVVKKVALALSFLVLGSLAILYFYTKNEKEPKQKQRFENTSPKNQKIRKPISSVMLKKEKMGNSTHAKRAKQAMTTESGFSEAEPIGGYDSLFAQLERQLKYPEKEKTMCISGTVLVEFYINTLGKAEGIAVVKGDQASFNEEAIRLIATMPAWKPAQLNGGPISTRHVIPIQFIIQTTKPNK